MLIGNYFKKVKPEYKKHYFSGINFNSRLCKKDNIFFVVKGNQTDGSKFIKDAIAKGAKTIIYDKKFEGFKNGILYLKFKNVRKTLAEISYKIFKIKIPNLIAVTGTNGKSSICDFYFQILNLNKKKVASLGTLGVKTQSENFTVTNTTLDPLQLSKYLEYLSNKKIDNIILEASSHGLKQHRLDGLKFNKGIFTNLSHDHLDYHKNYNDYLNAKLYLFKYLLSKKATVITDRDIPEYKKILKISKQKKINLRSISKQNGKIKILEHKFIGEKQFLKIEYNNSNFSFYLNLIGKIQIKNLFMAILAAENKSLKFKKIVKILNKIKPINGRLEKIGKLKNNAVCILDYAHTPEALNLCLSNIKEQFGNKNISIVLGCGGNRDRSKRSKIGKIADNYCNRIYLTDDNPRYENPKKIRNEIKKDIKGNKIFEIPDRKKAIVSAVNNLKSCDILIVAGKGHENTQDFGKRKIFFSDKNIILNSIRLKNKSLSNDLKVNILKEHKEAKKVNNLIKLNKASINSKNIKKNDIFFAIKGKKNDGNKFISEAIKKGASIVVTDKSTREINSKNVIKVKNSLDFMTKISSSIRDTYPGQIIGITGSCGKTTLKELLANCLNKFGKVSYSPKSYNNKYGVPLSLFNLNINNNYGVFEIGMDKKGEIDFLSSIVKPNIGVITNISYAHAKNFKSISDIAKAKAEIINNIKKYGSIILNADDKFFSIHKKIAKKRRLNIVSFGYSYKSDVKFLKLKKLGKNYKIEVQIFDELKKFKIRYKYKNYIKNILSALAVLYILKITKHLSFNFFKNFLIPKGRGNISKIKFKNKKIFLIDESYNSNPLSLSSAISNFSNTNIKSEKKHFLMGDMLELGKHSKKLHKDMSNILNNSKINKIHIYGNDVAETFKGIKKKRKGRILRKISDIYDLIVRDLNNNDYLMVKGSNSTGLNKIVETLRGSI